MKAITSLLFILGVVSAWDAAQAGEGAAAHLIVQTIPPGADVSVDGRPAGKSPVAVRVEAGSSYWVVVKTEGSELFKRKIAIERNRQRLLVELGPRTPRPFSPEIPRGARVFIDGIFAGESPALIFLQPGSCHRQRIEPPGLSVAEKLFQMPKVTVVNADASTTEPGKEASTEGIKPAEGDGAEDSESFIGLSEKCCRVGTELNLENVSPGQISAPKGRQQKALPVKLLLGTDFSVAISELLFLNFEPKLGLLLDDKWALEVGIPTMLGPGVEISGSFAPSWFCVRLAVAYVKSSFCFDCENRPTIFQSLFIKMGAGALLIKGHVFRLGIELFFQPAVILDEYVAGETFGGEGRLPFGYLFGAGLSLAFSIPLAGY